MDEYYRLDTPENIELSYTPAGLGSRFLATALDTIILLLLMLVLFAIAGVLLWATSRFGRPATSLILASAVLGSFLVFFGYYIFFEIIWKGQSPGKRAVGLRVIRDDGLPLNFSASVIRNLIRIIDFMPGTYGAGVLTMCLNKRWKRLGDIAAGTLVVRELSGVSPVELRLEAPSDTYEATQLAHPRLTSREYELVREYLVRYRQLTSESIARIEPKLVSLVEARTGIAKGNESAYAYLRSIAAVQANASQPIRYRE